ncbi:CLUMA_CG003344, isoform A [Clunio marinus]|uniref:CLUMA_CG003344, isoform A n=1 Tax=Clunio marinus TaxID=568069 RepID=A0A1J1HSX2_9DIPT|nr:CLUMA_CG003344, isoform A [Clunio marinus]
MQMSNEINITEGNDFLYKHQFREQKFYLLFRVDVTALASGWKWYGNLSKRSTLLMSSTFMNGDDTMGKRKIINYVASENT